MRTDVACKRLLLLLKCGDRECMASITAMVDNYICRAPVAAPAKHLFERTCGTRHADLYLVETHLCRSPMNQTGKKVCVQEMDRRPVTVDNAGKRLHYVRTDVACGGAAAVHP